MMAVQPLLVGPTLDQAVSEAHQIIEDAKARYPHVATIALFSGGNDSTTLLHLCRDVIDFALHINTGIGVEETREFVRDIAPSTGARLEERCTDPSVYLDLVTRYGMPGPMAHSRMYINLKERQLRAVKREVAPTRGSRVILLSGARASESERRMGTTEVIHREAAFVWVNPLLAWSDWTMYQYRQANNVPRNPVADRIHKSGECLCGSYAKPGEREELEMWFPDVAKRIHGIERRAAQAGHGARAEWGWGAHRLRRGKAPGPMCSSCHLFPAEAELAT